MQPWEQVVEKLNALERDFSEQKALQKQLDFLDGFVFKIEEEQLPHNLTALLPYLSPKKNWINFESNELNFELRKPYCERAYRLLTIFQEEIKHFVKDKENWELLVTLVSLRDIQYKPVASFSANVVDNTLSSFSTATKEDFENYVLEFQSSLFSRDDRLTEQGRRYAYELPPDKFRQDQTTTLLEPSWKSKNLFIPDVIYWIISNQTSFTIRDRWHKLIPSVLRILNDLKPMVKQKGLLLVQSIVDVSGLEFLTYTGLAEILREDLMLFYTFLPPRYKAETCASLIDSSFRLLIQIEKKIPNLLDKLFLDGVMYIFQFASDSIPVIRLAFVQCMCLMNKLNERFLRYLSTTLDQLCLRIQNPLLCNAPEFLFFLLETLRSMLIVYFYRISSHHTQFLITLVSSYRNCNNANLKELSPCKQKITEILQFVKENLSESQKLDYQAVLPLMESTTA
ncbi:tel Two Interacting protein 2 [Schizosaccharomyces cryophilus OY26]|uniref:Tel Two Interacting protein 2 n=1 Tax=Schizosaccharomyces cryophilus (strain OY26 / ATCC MYA-4695 / CBS 11777 / NBRC 106824 / NRRL Y48691) TaxID=653667 RepID=S9XJ06_SCHCR|nr:tel Two Interacting protein 2 [Schizosaccharomyces cryophilus OY26]EPY53616.1 tel Two Interacting protein 2 [Schizosaccharomyces cryophilus OY26]